MSRIGSISEAKLLRQHSHASACQMAVIKTFQLVAEEMKAARKKYGRPGSPLRGHPLQQETNAAPTRVLAAPVSPAPAMRAAPVATAPTAKATSLIPLPRKPEKRKYTRRTMSASR